MKSMKTTKFIVLKSFQLCGSCVTIILVVMMNQITYICMCFELLLVFSIIAA